jgi:hypothetical protein
MQSFMPGTILIVLGVTMVIFRNWAAHSAAEWNYKLLGIRFSEQGYQISFFTVGLIFVVLGLLVLFQIIRFK